MKKLLFLLFTVLIGQWANAAKPIDVVVDSITYRLNLSSNSFCVYKTGFDLQVANIRDSINYEGISYPVTTIAEWAFSDGVNFMNNEVLIQVNVPNTVKEIGSNAFYSCSNIESISLPDSLVSIGEQAFGRCRKIKELTFPSTLEYIGPLAFQENSIEKIVFNCKNTRIDYGAFDDCYKLKRVYVSSLEDWLSINFNHHGYFDEINPLSPAHANLYVNNELVENLIIPDGLLEVKASSFIKCGSLHSVQFPNSVEFIGYGAFYNCNDLKTIEIGSGIEVIYEYAFADCPNLETVIIHALNPPAIGATFINSYPEYMTLHIPEGTKDLYENADGWKDFGTIIDDLPNDSGVDEVSIDESKAIEIFNLSGVLVFFGIGDYKLPSGIYIIMQGGKSKKIVIK